MPFSLAPPEFNFQNDPSMAEDQISTPPKKPPQRPDSPWINLLVTVVLPVIILNQGTKHIGALPALIVALLFPLVYGLREFLTKGKPSMLSVLGILNVVFTGGFALVRLSGIWFAVKEAVFPTLIGLFVYLSSYTRKPFMLFLFKNPQIINVELLEQKLAGQQNESSFMTLMKTSTQVLSLSFVLSAILNFGLAWKIFIPLDAALSFEGQGEALNSQIAEMTKWSVPVIMLPSMIIVTGIFLWVLKRVQGLSGLTQDQLIKTQ